MSPDTSTPMSPPIDGREAPDTSPGIELPAASRRRVLATGSVAVLGAMGLAACGSDDDSPSATTQGGSEGSTPSASAGGGDTVVALADVPVGGAVAAEAAGQKLVVAQPEAGTVVAYSSTCPHRGCAVAPKGDQFACPCHNSTFTFADGSVTGGPATSGLTKVAVSVDGDNVVLG